MQKFKLYVSSLALIAGVCVGITGFTLASHPLGVAVTVTGGTSASATPDSTKAAPPPQKCGTNNPVVGYIGTLQPGVSVASLPGQASVAELRSLNGGPTLVESFTKSGLTGGSGLSSFGAVRLLSTIESLQSCYYHFSNRPATQPYVAAAESALSKAGFVTEANADSPLAAYISEDPLSANAELVTLGYEGPPDTSVPADWSDATPHTMVKYMAVVENGSYSVSSVGELQPGS